MARRKSIADQVRAEIRARGVTGYRISKETGISEATLSRFLRKLNDLDMANLDLVCRFLGLTLVREDELVELRKGKG